MVERISPSQLWRLTATLVQGQKLSREEAGRILAGLGEDEWRALDEARRRELADQADELLRELGLMLSLDHEGENWSWHNHPVIEGTPYYCPECGALIGFVTDSNELLIGSGLQAIRLRQGTFTCMCGWRKHWRAWRLGGRHEP
jgi:hypothetical protein